MATYNGFKSIEGKEFYERTLLHALKENNILLQFAKKEKLPKNHGDTITWRKRKPVPVQRDANGKVRTLIEGVTPSSNTLGFVEYKATIKEYGDWIPLTKKLTNLAIDPVLTEASEGLGESAGDTFDALMLETMYANPNVHFARNKNSSTLTASDTLQIADLNRIKATFKKRNVKPFADGFYMLIISPEVEYDIKNDTTVNASWVDISKYTESEVKNIVKGEIGRIFGFKVVVYNKLETKPFYAKTSDQSVQADKTYYTLSNGVYTAVANPADASLSSYYEVSFKAFKCIAMGKDGIGTVDLEGNSAAKPTVFYNKPGSQGDDQLHRKHSVAWCNEGFTARIIYPEALSIVYIPTTLEIDDYVEGSNDVNYDSEINGTAGHYMTFDNADDSVL